MVLKKKEIHDQDEEVEESNSQKTETDQSPHSAFLLDARRQAAIRLRAVLGFEALRKRPVR